MYITGIRNYTTFRKVEESHKTRKGILEEREEREKKNPKNKSRYSNNSHLEDHLGKNINIAI